MTATTSTATKLDSIAAAFKEAAGRLADLLRQQAVLKSDLEKAATEADAEGLADFAQALRDLAANLGPSNDHNAKPTVPPSKRRGRPPKAPDEPTAP